MVAGFVQQREDQCIFVYEWMEGEPGIKTYEAGASNMKRLRVHDPSMRVDFIFDAGERSPKFRRKNFQDPIAAFRAAKGDIRWQDGCVQHGGTGSLLPQSCQIGTMNHLLRMFNGKASELGPFIPQSGTLRDRLGKSEMWQMRASSTLKEDAKRGNPAIKMKTISVVVIILSAAVAGRAAARPPPSRADEHWG